MLPTELGLLCPPLNALLHTTLPRGVVQCGGHLLRSLLSGYAVFQVAEPEACDQMYESLARLHSNYYKHKVSGHGPCSQPPMGELIIQCFVACGSSVTSTFSYANSGAQQKPLKVC